MLKFRSQGISRIDAFSPSWLADAGEQHGFHLLEMEAHGRLGDAQHEVAAFHGDGLGVAGDEVSGEFLPCGADLVLVQAVLGTGGAQDGGDELLRASGCRR